MNLSLLIAILPIILFLLLSILSKWEQVKIGFVTLLFVIFVGYLMFGINAELVFKSFLKAVFVSLDVLLIIWSALFLHNISVYSGMLDKLGSSVKDITNDRKFVILFFGWLFPSFLQGIGGFGVPVAICAPLLINAGFSPVIAVILPSIGHVWSITFGSMGSAYAALLTATELPNSIVGPDSSLMLGILAIVCGLMVVIIAEKGKNILGYIWLVLILGGVMGFGQYLLVLKGFWSIAVAISSMAAILLVVFFVKFGFFFKNYSSKIHKVEKINEGPPLWLAMMPYFLIVFFSIITMIEPVDQILSQLKLYLNISKTELSNGYVIDNSTTKVIEILNHPGTMILLASIIVIIILMYKGYLGNTKLLQIVKTTYQRNIKPSFALFCIASVALIMDDSRMLLTIAEGISATFTGFLFPLVSPFIGALGAFITGSNMNSNVIFSSLQMQTAMILSLKVPLILAMQTAGGAIGSVISPSKIIVGCSTVDLGNKVNQVYKYLIGSAVLLLMTVIVVSLFYLK